MGNEAVLSFPFHTETRYDMCRTSNEVPRATCNERGARNSPRHLATSAEREVPRAGILIKESQSAFAVHPFIFTKNRVIYHFAGDI